MAKRRREGVGTTRPVVDEHFKAWVEAMGGTMLVAPRVIAAFMRLREAWSASLPQTIEQQASWDPWNCAVSLGILRDDFALTDAEMCWLVDRDLVAFRLETTRSGRRSANSSRARRRNAKGGARDSKPAAAAPRDRGARRTFRMAAVLTFAPNTCFIVTQAGVELCAHLQNDFTKGKLRSAPAAVVNAKDEREPAEKPATPADASPKRAKAVDGAGEVARPEKLRWNSASGEWMLNDELIRPAVAPRAYTQRQVLGAGEAAGWIQPVAVAFAHRGAKGRIKFLSSVLGHLNEGQNRIHLICLDKGRSFGWKVNHESRR
ncbi:MAG TPA: hypothetical protein VND64_14905 [Pirellulales bacterium]|nr:hypothetical protein [Pirellulales bacterium]